MRLRTFLVIPVSIEVVGPIHLLGTHLTDHFHFDVQLIELLPELGDDVFPAGGVLGPGQAVDESEVE